MTIEAIETDYAGYRFRSRLEARWAVFFRHLGIRWDYEPQGYRVGPAKRPYLPDFWLPDLGTWVEVKGDPAALDRSLIDDAVSYPGGLPKSDAWGNLNVLILGAVPEPGRAWLHWNLSRTVYAQPRRAEEFCACRDLHYTLLAFQAYPKAALLLYKDEFGYMPPSPGAILTQIGHLELTAPDRDLVSARPCRFLVPDPLVDAALRAARSARWEHGEQPAEPPADVPEPEDPHLVGDDLRERISMLAERHKPDPSAS